MKQKQDTKKKKIAKIKSYNKSMLHLNAILKQVFKDIPRKTHKAKNIQKGKQFERNNKYYLQNHSGYHFSLSVHLKSTILMYPNKSWQKKLWQIHKKFVHICEKRLTIRGS